MALTSDDETVLIGIAGAGAMSVAVVWVLVQAARRWVAAQRRRWTVQGLDILHTDLQRFYPSLYARLDRSSPTRPQERQDMAWVLEQVEAALDRRRRLAQELDLAPHVPRAHLIAAAGLASLGMVLLAVALLR